MRTPTAEEFDALSPVCKHVVIAQDVITQLDAGRYQAKEGVYVQSLKDDDDFDRKRSDLLLEQDCKVCAVGGVFLSLARLSHRLMPCTDLHEALLPYFGEAIHTIEAAFEQFEETDAFDSFEYVGPANPTARLRAIMENIVEWGEFNEAEYRKEVANV